MRLLRLAAWLWLVLCLALGALALAQREAWLQRVDSDLFALLPRDARDPQAEAVLERLARQGERQLVLMASGADRAEARAVAESLRARLKSQPLAEEAIATDATALRDWFKPHRAGLASRADQQALLYQPLSGWTQRAAALALSPLGAGGLAWADDPYGLFGNWLLERAATSPARPVEGLLEVARDGRTDVLLNYRVEGSAFSLDLQESLDRAVGEAIAAERLAHPKIEIRRAGVLVHAAAAARSAQTEMNLIGNGSILGVVLLTLLSFRGWRPLPLMLLPVLIGSLWAVGASFLLYERVHLLTLVFGASLIGVAVDYAEHALGASIDAPLPPPVRYRRLLPSMLMALGTTVIAYLGLLLTPFPGLAQMAVFAAVGICAAWLCVMLWYPFVAPASVRAGPASGWLLRTPDAYPRWPGGWRGGLLAGLVGLFLALGLARLVVDDDVRNLVSTRPDLLAEQVEVSRALGLPSPAQFFLVSAATPEALLRREEALTVRLREAIGRGDLSGYLALSDWLPSAQSQMPRVEANLRLLGPEALAELRRTLELESDWQPAAPGRALLEPAALAGSPLAPLSDRLWLGQGKDGRYASVVMLQGLAGKDAAGRLARLADPSNAAARVQWVDKPARISELFGQYRIKLLWLVAFALAVSVPLLWWRFRHDSWRVLAPVLLAGGGTLALMGWIGMPMQLLTVMALLVIIGMGVDYGIFIVDSRGDPRSFVATLLAASTTVLSFGLLAFSSTPALRSFGFAIFAGVGLAAMCAPLFRHREAT